MITNYNLEFKPVSFLLKAVFILLEEVSHDKESSLNTASPVK